MKRPPDMVSKIDNWGEKDGKKTLEHIGIKSGQRVLDFGCGEGNYTIPAARIVSKRGLVYGLDKDKDVLDKLMAKAKSLGLKNVRTSAISEESKIGLENETIDVVLLYDVLHYYYYPRQKERRKLLREVYRVLKPGAILSLYPTHLESDRKPNLAKVEREIAEANFHLDHEYPEMIMLHDNKLEKGRVINFKK